MARSVSKNMKKWSHGYIKKPSHKRNMYKCNILIVYIDSYVANL